MNHASLLDLLKLCQEQRIEVVFWYGRNDTIRGIPRYHGFDIDVGEMFMVNGKSVALHDFRSIVIGNPDNHAVREYARGHSQAG